jgi:hypothetical protein
VKQWKAVFIFTTALSKASVYQVEGKEKPVNITQDYPNDGGKSLSGNTSNLPQKYVVPKHGILQSHTSLFLVTLVVQLKQ